MLRLVINLDKSVDRLTQVSNQLAKLNIPFERIRAINGKELNESIKKSIIYPIDHFETKVRFTRALTDGEIGCFLSHRKCWERLLESNEDWALVMEDDITISHLAYKYLLNSSWIPNDVQICQISCLEPLQKGRIGIERPIDSTLSIVTPKSPTSLGTQAYLISRSFALRALELSIKLPAPVDNFMFSPWFDLYHEFTLWKTSPTLVIPNTKSPSDIGERKTKTKKAPFLIRHGLTRILLDLKIKKLQSEGKEYLFKYID